MITPTATREICKICWRVNRIGFSVPDGVWELVVPEPFRDKVVCLECFTRLGDECMVGWDFDIDFYPVSLATHLELTMRPHDPEPESERIQCVIGRTIEPPPITIDDD